MSDHTKARMRRRAFFLTVAERKALRDLMRKRKIEALKARRANALLLLDQGKSAQFVAKVLFLDPDTVRGWLRDFHHQGLASLEAAEYPEREGYLNSNQEGVLKAHFRDNPPRDSNEVRDDILRIFGVSYSRPGAIKLMHRLGFEYLKPKRLPKEADREAQEKFIDAYKRLTSGMKPDERVVFVDAVHPEYQSRPVAGWFLKSAKPAVRSTTGGQRLNVHGALDLEEPRLTWVAGKKVNAKTTLRLFERLEHSYPESRIIHLILDNARYHHAKLLRPFLERPECRIRLHFLPAYAPQRTDSSGLNPIERLWGVMHRQVTHNRCYPDFHQFAEAIFGFFDRTLPENWHTIRSTVTDNFRVITHDQFRLIG